MSEIDDPNNPKKNIVINNNSNITNKIKLKNFQSKTIDNCLSEEPEINEMSPINQKEKSPIANVEQTSVSNSSTTTSIQQHQIANTPPAVDFKLDVKIEINSGKCILHAAKTSNTNSSIKNEQQQQQQQSDRLSYSSYYNMNLNDSNRSRQPSGFNNSKMNILKGGDPSEFRITNFIFPAIKLKAFYESSHKKSLDLNRLSKKANLYAMIKLESFVMPTFTHNLMSKDIMSSRDMCISPALLDFLEQTLEPFDNIMQSQFEPNSNVNTPIYNLNNNNNNINNTGLNKSYFASPQQQQKQQRTNDFNENKVNFRNNASNESQLNEPASSFGKEVVSKNQKTNQETTASYFPVEVVVFVNMLPSSIRFTCLPQSTMECLLKLPTLEMVFSTYKIDSHLQESIFNKLNEEDNLPNEEKFKSKTTSRANNENISNSILPFANNSTSDSNNARKVEEGGLSVTCSMTDFSLKFYNRLALRNTNDPRFFYSEQSSKSLYLISY